jgi:hypothetical protein
MTEWLVVVPACGRDYKTAAEARRAWVNDADYRIVSVGPDMDRYINRQYWLKYAPCSTVEIRFNQREDFTIIKGITVSRRRP